MSQEPQISPTMNSPANILFLLALIHLSTAIELADIQLQCNNDSWVTDPLNLASQHTKTLINLHIQRYRSFTTPSPRPICIVLIDHADNTQGIKMRIKGIDLVHEFTYTLFTRSELPEEAIVMLISVDDRAMRLETRKYNSEHGDGLSFKASNRIVYETSKLLRNNKREAALLKATKMIVDELSANSKKGELYAAAILFCVATGLSLVLYKLARIVETEEKAKQNVQKLLNTSTAKGELRALIETNCGICLEKCSVQHARTLSCGHRFHNHCIDRWIATKIATSATCPYCRKKLHGKETNEDHNMSNDDQNRWKMNLMNAILITNNLHWADIRSSGESISTSNIMCNVSSFTGVDGDSFGASANW